LRCVPDGFDFELGVLHQFPQLGSTLQRSIQFGVTRLAGHAYRSALYIITRRNRGQLLAGGIGNIDCTVPRPPVLLKIVGGKLAYRSNGLSARRIQVGQIDTFHILGPDAAIAIIEEISGHQKA
jgi:hypothetical protein